MQEAETTQIIFLVAFLQVPECFVGWVPGHASTMSKILSSSLALISRSLEKNLEKAKNAKAP